jgi:hypothetical protein
MRLSVSRHLRQRVHNLSGNIGSAADGIRADALDNGLDGWMLGHQSFLSLVQACAPSATLSIQMESCAGEVQDHAFSFSTNR